MDELYKGLLKVPEVKVAGHTNVWKKEASKELKKLDSNYKGDIYDIARIRALIIIGFEERSNSLEELIMNMEGADI